LIRRGRPAPAAPTGGTVTSPVSWTLGGLAGLAGLVLLFLAVGRLGKRFGQA
jgi:hypothetical protein